MATDRKVVKQAMENIRAYFKKNPDAADTAEGVSCWLANERLAIRDDSILEALEHLVELGEVQKEKLPGDKVLYRRRRAASGLQ